MLALETKILACSLLDLTYKLLMKGMGTVLQILHFIISPRYSMRVWITWHPEQKEVRLKDGRTDGRMDRFPLCSTGLRPLRGRCPAPSQPSSLPTQAGHGYRWPLTAFGLLKNFLRKCLSKMSSFVMLHNRVLTEILTHYVFWIYLERTHLLSIHIQYRYGFSDFWLSRKVNISFWAGGQSPVEHGEFYLFVHLSVVVSPPFWAPISLFRPPTDPLKPQDGPHRPQICPLKLP